jgi:hypothetical protein
MMNVSLRENGLNQKFGMEKVLIGAVVGNR